MYLTRYRYTYELPYKKKYEVVTEKEWDKLSEGSRDIILSSNGKAILVKYIGKELLDLPY
jgi:hypothetical protein